MKRVLVSVACGLILTIALTTLGLSQDSRRALCGFVWQACLVQIVVRTPDNPVREASPIDLFDFALGVLLGVPIYSGISYGLLTTYARFSEKQRRE
jgi:ribose/xylose/arabinose/galactoside ABC-type transport system permease subunit